MGKYILITYKNGEQFILPVSVIVDHMTRYYVNNDYDTDSVTSCYDLAAEDDNEKLIYWLNDNMSYEDVEGYLIKVDPHRVDYKAEFFSSKKEIIDDLDYHNLFEDIK